MNGGPGPRESTAPAHRHDTARRPMTSHRTRTCRRSTRRRLRSLSVGRRARTAIARRPHAHRWHRATVAPCRMALGRVLAADVVSPIDVPAHDNSAMDGYAFDGAALRADAASDAVAASAPSVAGAPCERRGRRRRLPAHHDRRRDARRLPTPWCRMELCARRGRAAFSIEPASCRRGENRRRRGEDLAARQAGAGAPGRVLRAGRPGPAGVAGHRRGHGVVRRAARGAVLHRRRDCAPRASRWRRAASTTATATA
ncbi:MAG: hypothetical protein MZW92_59390 [Comamonadaceae bacterium]|nr:hypothetical protein [Comamonadaceae bacterium]